MRSGMLADRLPVLKTRGDSDQVQPVRGTYWLPDQDDVWVTGKRGLEDGDEVHFTTTEDARSIVLSKKEADDVQQVYSDQVNGIDDICALVTVSEAAMLHTVRVRYAKQLIYTRVARTLIAVNPFGPLPIYSNEIMDQYKARSNSLDMPPHIFGIGQDAIRGLREATQDQAVLISGESGAGKTESAKLIMSFVVDTMRQGGKGTTDLVLQTNPVLEALGNAMTVRNNNSSRFGKWLDLRFTRRLEAVGCVLHHYLLETTRVCAQAKGERGFHIFFQMIKARSTPSLSDLGLGDPSTYTYLRNGQVDAPGVDDLRNFDEMRDALLSLGFSASTQASMFRVLAGILTLGNVDFRPVGEGSAVADRQPLDRAAELFGVEAQPLETLILIRKIVVGREKTRAHNRVEQAKAVRDGLSRLLYGKIFQWIISEMNTKLAAGDSGAAAQRLLGVLDIAGFESFEHNSLEQLLINLSNEHLQQQFNHSLIKSEAEECEKEGVKMPQIEGFMDNADILALIDAKGGVLDFLDETCATSFTNVTEQTFLNRVVKEQKGHPRLIIPKVNTGKPVFAIKHFAGEVLYTCTQWLEKNLEKLPPDTGDVLCASTVKFVQGLGNLVLEPTTASPRGSMVSARSSMAKIKTVSGSFRVSLKDLMSRIRNATNHYVRCIKPNSTKTPGRFDARPVMEQLLFSGVFAAVDVRQKGYAYRITHSEFVFLYNCIVARPTPKKGANMRNEAKEVIALLPDALKIKVRVDLPVDCFALGHTKVFSKFVAVRALDHGRQMALKGFATRIQKTWRGFVQRRAIKELKALFKKISRLLQDMNLGDRRMGARRKTSDLVDGESVLEKISSVEAAREYLAMLAPLVVKTKAMEVENGTFRQADWAVRRVRRELSVVDEVEGLIKSVDPVAIEKALRRASSLPLPELPILAALERRASALKDQLPLVKAMEAALAKPSDAAREEAERIRKVVEQADLTEVPGDWILQLGGAKLWERILKLLGEKPTVSKPKAVESAEISAEQARASQAEVEAKIAEEKAAWEKEALERFASERAALEQEFMKKLAEERARADAESQRVQAARAEMEQKLKDEKEAADKALTERLKESSGKWACEWAESEQKMKDLFLSEQAAQEQEFTKTLTLQRERLESDMKKKISVANEKIDSLQKYAQDCADTTKEKTEMIERLLGQHAEEDKELRKKMHEERLAASEEMDRRLSAEHAKLNEHIAEKFAMQQAASKQEMASMEERQATQRQFAEQLAEAKRAAEEQVTSKWEANCKSLKDDLVNKLDSEKRRLKEETERSATVKAELETQLKLQRAQAEEELQKRLKEAAEKQAELDTLQKERVANEKDYNERLTRMEMQAIADKEKAAAERRELSQTMVSERGQAELETAQKLQELTMRIHIEKMHVEQQAMEKYAAERRAADEEYTNKLAIEQAKVADALRIATELSAAQRELQDRCHQSEQESAQKVDALKSETDAAEQKVAELTAKGQETMQQLDTQRSMLNFMTEQKEAAEKERKDAMDSFTKRMQDAERFHSERVDKLAADHAESERTLMKKIEDERLAAKQELQLRLAEERDASEKVIAQKIADEQKAAALLQQTEEQRKKQEREFEEKMAAEKKAADTSYQQKLASERKALEDQYKKKMQEERARSKEDIDRMDAERKDLMQELSQELVKQRAAAELDLQRKLQDTADRMAKERSAAEKKLLQDHAEQMKKAQLDFQGTLSTVEAQAEQEHLRKLRTEKDKLSREHAEEKRRLAQSSEVEKKAVAEESAKKVQALQDQVNAAEKLAAELAAKGHENMVSMAEEAERSLKELETKLKVSAEKERAEAMRAFARDLAAAELKHNESLQDLVKDHAKKEAQMREQVSEERDAAQKELELRLAAEREAANKAFAHKLELERAATEHEQMSREQRDEVERQWEERLVSQKQSAQKEFAQKMEDEMGRLDGEFNTKVASVQAAAKVETEALEAKRSELQQQLQQQRAAAEKELERKLQEATGRHHEQRLRDQDEASRAIGALQAQVEAADKMAAEMSIRNEENLLKVREEADLRLKEVEAKLNKSASQERAEAMEVFARDLAAAEIQHAEALQTLMERQSEKEAKLREELDGERTSAKEEMERRLQVEHEAATQALEHQLAVERATAEHGKHAQEQRENLERSFATKLEEERSRLDAAFNDKLVAEQAKSKVEAEAFESKYSALEKQLEQQRQAAETELDRKLQESSQRFAKERHEAEQLMQERFKSELLAADKQAGAELGKMKDQVDAAEKLASDTAAAGQEKMDMMTEEAERALANLERKLKQAAQQERAEFMLMFSRDMAAAESKSAETIQALVAGHAEKESAMLERMREERKAAEADVQDKLEAERAQKEKAVADKISAERDAEEQKQLTDEQRQAMERRLNEELQKKKEESRKFFQEQMGKESETIVEALEKKFARERAALAAEADEVASQRDELKGQLAEQRKQAEQELVRKLRESADKMSDELAAAEKHLKATHLAELASAKDTLLKAHAEDSLKAEQERSRYMQKELLKLSQKHAEARDQMRQDFHHQKYLAEQEITKSAGRKISDMRAQFADDLGNKELEYEQLLCAEKELRELERRQKEAMEKERAIAMEKFAKDLAAAEASNAENMRQLLEAQAAKEDNMLELVGREREAADRDHTHAMEAAQREVNLATRLGVEQASAEAQATHFEARKCELERQLIEQREAAEQKLVRRLQESSDKWASKVAAAEQQLQEAHGRLRKLEAEEKQGQTNWAQLETVVLRRTALERGRTTSNFTSRTRNSSMRSDSTLSATQASTVAAERVANVVHSSELEATRLLAEARKGQSEASSAGMSKGINVSIQDLKNAGLPELMERDRMAAGRALERFRLSSAGARMEDQCAAGFSQRAGAMRALEDKLIAERFYIERQLAERLAAETAAAELALERRLSLRQQAMEGEAVQRLADEQERRQKEAEQCWEQKLAAEEKEFQRRMTVALEAVERCELAAKQAEVAARAPEDQSALKQETEQAQAELSNMRRKSVFVSEQMAEEQATAMEDLRRKFEAEKFQAQLEISKQMSGERIIAERDLARSLVSSHATAQRELCLQLVCEHQAEKRQLSEELIEEHAKHEHACGVLHSLEMAAAEQAVAASFHEHAEHRLAERLASQNDELRSEHDAKLTAARATIEAEMEKRVAAMEVEKSNASSELAALAAQLESERLAAKQKLQQKFREAEDASSGLSTAALLEQKTALESEFSALLSSKEEQHEKAASVYQDIMLRLSEERNALEAGSAEQLQLVVKQLNEERKAAEASIAAECALERSQIQDEFQNALMRATRDRHEAEQALLQNFAAEQAALERMFGSRLNVEREEFAAKFAEAQADYDAQRRRRRSISGLIVSERQQLLKRMAQAVEEFDVPVLETLLRRAAEDGLEDEQDDGPLNKAKEMLAMLNTDEDLLHAIEQAEEEAASPEAEWGTLVRLFNLACQLHKVFKHERRCFEANECMQLALMRRADAAGLASIFQMKDSRELSLAMRVFLPLWQFRPIREAEAWSDDDDLAVPDAERGRAISSVSSVCSHHSMVISTASDAYCISHASTRRVDDEDEETTDLASGYKAMLSHSKHCISKSLTRPPRRMASEEFNATAAMNFANVLVVMGDRPAQECQRQSCRSAILELARATDFALDACYNLKGKKAEPPYKDEVYVQVLKQLSHNPSRRSQRLGWELLRDLCNNAPPRPLLAEFLRAFVLRMAPDLLADKTCKEWAGAVTDAVFSSLNGGSLAGWLADKTMDTMWWMLQAPVNLVVGDAEHSADGRRGQQGRTSITSQASSVVPAASAPRRSITLSAEASKDKCSVM